VYARTNEFHVSRAVVHEPSCPSALASRLRQLSVSKPPAILLGNGSTNDLSFVRSLGRRRIPTVLVVDGRLLGSFSRYGLRIRMPCGGRSADAWIEILEIVASALRPPRVLFALSDAHCEFLSRNSERLEPSFRFVLPNAEAVETILDKRRQYAAAERAGMKIPATSYPQDIDDVKRLAPHLEYPVILKPYTAHLGRPRIANRKVLVIENASELLSAFSSCATSGARFMVQEIVDGNDDAIFWYSGFWDEHGRERAWFTVQKLRPVPARIRRRLPSTDGGRARRAGAEPAPARSVAISRACHGRIQA
jgi:predicted ATP-grasp superfamily ATP-dependent carboligase